MFGKYSSEISNLMSESGGGEEFLIYDSGDRQWTSVKKRSLKAVSSKDKQNGNAKSRMLLWEGKNAKVRMTTTKCLHTK